LSADQLVAILTPLGLLTVALAVVGSVTDIRTRRIPNWLTAGAFLLAILFRVAGGTESVLAGLAGAGIAFLVALALHLVKAIGAGDVKYLTAFGAILGAGRIWPALLLVTFAGAALALLWAMVMGRGAELRRSVYQLALFCATLGFFGSRRILSDAGSEVALAPIPLGVAIAAGCTLVWFV
jgi:prepilin peptidase CpaA